MTAPLSAPGSGWEGLAKDVQAPQSHIYEVEMQVPTTLYKTVYVEAESEDQANAVALKWAEESRVEEWDCCDDCPNTRNIDGPWAKPIPDEWARHEDILKVTPDNCLHERIRTDQIKPVEGEAHAEVDGTCLVCGALMEGYAEIEGADDDGRPEWAVDKDAWEVRT